MSNFNAFMCGNCEVIENKKVVVSNRFKDENGKPIKWEIKAISSAENDELQRRCFVNIPVPGQRNQYNRELDNVLYAARLVAASVVFPDLNNAALQDSYGVKTPEALLTKMLYMSEYNKLAAEVTALSNNENMGELVEEAKN